LSAAKFPSFACRSPTIPFLGGAQKAMARLALLFSAVAVLDQNVVSSNPVAAAQASAPAGLDHSVNAVTVPGTPAAAGAPVLESFVSFSIEFAFFPDFAGNTTAPNTFSGNLLSNLGEFQGTKPHIRVGGNTQ
jgi:hypothetical protein